MRVKANFFLSACKHLQASVEEQYNIVKLTLYNSLSEFDTHLVLVEPDVFKVPISLGKRCKENTG